MGAGIPEKVDIPRDEGAVFHDAGFELDQCRRRPGAHAVNSSVLVMTIFTGLPLFMARAMVIGSRRGSILPPNPPPTLVQITRILLSGTPKRAGHHRS